MLETQMIHQEAVQHHRLESYLTQHCHSWHTFARSLDIHISFGDLMLVTECSKAAAWSSAVYSNSSTEFGLSFSIGMPFATAGISASTSLAKIGPIERRRSQLRARAHGSPLPKNHTVFIKAYRLGMRQSYYHSLVSVFMRARGQSFNGNRSNKESANDVALRPGLAASQNTSPPSSSIESYIIRPFDPVSFNTLSPLHHQTQVNLQDFHASIALLGLEMEVRLYSRSWSFIIYSIHSWLGER